MEKRSTVAILGGLLVLCLVIMVFMGNGLYKSGAANVLLENQNTEYVKEIGQLREQEVSLREDAADKLVSLDKEVTEIKEESKKRTDEIEENTAIELAELDTIEFYPLYVMVSGYGGAEAEDQLRD